jgi:UDP-N-acetylmuramyl tripeptide synthase
LRLEELAAKGHLLTRPERGDVDVAGVRSDAASVRPGDVFVLVGTDYAQARAAVAEAVRRGAVAVVADEGSDVSCDVPVLRAQDARRSLAFMAAGLAPRAATLRVAGVTGVSGKSSLLRLFASAMNGSRLPTTTLENVGRAIGRGVRTRRATALHAERTAFELASVA